MAQNNYNSPGGMYPLESGVQGRAFGSGTVPGSVLAGMMLPERMQDYRNSRDLSTQSGQLANLQKQAEYQDFLAQGPLREAQRRQQMGEAKHATALQPRALDIATAEQMGKYQRVPTEENNKLMKALNELPTEQRSQVLQELGAAATVLGKYPKNSRGEFDRPDLISQELSRQGMNISPEYINSVSKLRPEDIKAAHDMTKTKYTEEQHMSRTQIEQENANLRARIAASADRSSAAGMKEQNLEKHTGNYIRLRKKQLMREGLSEEDAEDTATLEASQTRMKEPTYGQAAIGNREVGVPGKLVDSIRGKTPEPISNVPPTPQGKKKTIDIPGAGTMEVVGREGKRIRIRDPKTGKLGWYEE